MLADMLDTLMLNVALTLTLFFIIEFTDYMTFVWQVWEWPVFLNTQMAEHHFSKLFIGQ